MKRVVILGSTGSIGRQTLEVVRAHDALQVLGLAAGANLPLLAEQVREFRPAVVSCKNNACPDLGVPVRYCSLEEMAALPEADLVVVATVGKVGLAPTLSALRAGKSVALANKEVLVMAGALVAEAAQRYGGALLPVDSEHSAIWQCLVGEPGSPRPSVRRLILTASGGAFRDTPVEELAAVTPAQALRHPTWRMGPKVTVDSATLMNKGFEVIEARWLFGYPLEQIEVIMHRESIVHSLVEFADGIIKAQLGQPDMRLPIQYALTYPERWPSPIASPDFATSSCLTFEPLDERRYPCLALALEAARAGGTYPAVLSAADEVAVSRFLAGGMAFPEIHHQVAEALARHQPVYNPSVEAVLEADRWTRESLGQRSPREAD
ncbi:MAG: 1-deoxy-D-xylulose-5-phosphate reductoisomerase [Chloroflexi bacterium]|nr:1-deoxy-D-xylulose-5-phosphate reductoisomerase [Chloroflexota bacterium]